MTTDAEVDDISAEWIDRYGPVPDAAANLLALGRLRAVCHRLGVTEISILRGSTARIMPVDLKVSEQMRLKRLAPKSVYKEDAEEIHLPVKPSPNLAAELTDFLNELMPAAETVG